MFFFKMLSVWWVILKISVLSMFVNLNGVYDLIWGYILMK